MSLVVAVYTPNGIVLAADSRTTATRGQRKEEGGKTIIREEHVVLSDNSFKLVKLSKLSCGVGTFGAALINNQPIDSYIRNFEEKRIKGEESVEKVAQKLVKFFVEKFPKEKIGFIVAGYQKENDVSIPYVYYTHTKQQQKPKRVNSNSNGAITYGIFRGGDTLIVNRLIAKEFLPPFQAMPLQDAVDYAVYLIRTTIDTLRFEPRFPTVGGPIDVLAVTPEEIKFIQKKELHGDWLFSFPRLIDGRLRERLADTVLTSKGSRRIAPTSLCQFVAHCVISGTRGSYSNSISLRGRRTQDSPL